MFQAILQSNDSDNTERNKIKLALSKAISMGEGCSNEKLYSRYLVLKSSRVSDPIGKSFRLFPLEDYEIVVNGGKQYSRYIEYEPTYFSFVNTKYSNIKIDISLDLFEMLFFIEKGFTPSLNDINGRFVELSIFKNHLINLAYQEVLVTQDNIKFFRISNNDNILKIEGLVGGFND